MALDLPFYDIFAPQKVPLLKISDDVIACNLWFGSPQSKSWLRLWLQWSLTEAYLGGGALGHGPLPPLGRQDSIYSL